MTAELFYSSSLSHRFLSSISQHRHFIQRTEDCLIGRHSMKWCIMKPGAPFSCFLFCSLMTMTAQVDQFRRCVVIIITSYTALWKKRYTRKQTTLKDAVRRFTMMMMMSKPTLYFLLSACCNLSCNKAVKEIHAHVLLSLALLI